jgi:hypothetical protein
VFYKRPVPIEGIIKSSGTGAEGVIELSKCGWYWIPSIPNLANIDAALVLESSNGSITRWCIQYPVAKDHAFNSKTFLVKFLRPVLKTMGLKVDAVSVVIHFIVTHDIFKNFKLPEEVKGPGYEAKVAFAHCSTVDTASNVFDSLGFIEEPLRFFTEEPDKKRAKSR